MKKRYVVLALLVFALCAPAQSALAAGILSRPPNNLGLVGYWPLDDGAGTVARDASGNGNIGTLQNSPTWVTGQMGTALSFDGSSQSVFGTVTSASQKSFSALTISVWARATNLGANASLFGRTDGSTIYQTNGAFGLDLNIAAGSKFGFHFNNGTDNRIAFNFTPSTNTWYHLVATFDSSTGAVALYVNGVQSVSTTLSAASIASITNGMFRIAQWDTSTSQFWFPGTLDDVRIYNRALSAADVTALYNIGAAKLGATKGASSQSTLISSGLVGYWTFDGKNTNWASGTTADASSNGNTGSLISMSTSTSPVLGKIGQAMSFNGTSQYVSTGIYSIYAAPYTISAWIKPSATQTAGLVAQRNGCGPGNESYILTMESNVLKLYAGNVSTAQTGTIQNNVWTHVVGIYNGSTLQLYVNGAQSGTPTAATPASSATATQIGKDGGTCTSYFRGSIDDVRIYNRALSATEIQKLYQAGTGVTLDTSNPQALTGGGLVGHWSFDGKYVNWATGQALDSSGNGRNGSLVNMSTTTSPAIGKIGQALALSGNNDAVSVSSAGLPSGNAPRSLSVWIKTLQAPASSNYPGIVEYGTRVNNQNYLLSLFPANGQLQGNCNIQGTVGISFWGSNGTACAGVAVNDGKWHHVVVTYDGTSNRIYLDGVLKNTQTPSPSPSTVLGSALVISETSNTNGIPPFQGSIDDVRIYNRAISPSEVQALYNLGR